MDGPDFVVVGAMKAGTTTLYEDLLRHPSVYMAEKELGYLGSPEILTPSGRARYGDLFRRAPAGHSRGDVSAGYAKLPESEGVAERAVSLLPTGFKVIYIVRDPVDRIVSHYHHETVRGAQLGTLDDAIRRVPRLIGYTRYTSQLAPWVDAVGDSNVRVVQLERYAAARPQVLDSIYAFLGLAEIAESLGPLVEVFNQSEGRPVAVGSVGDAVRSPIYRRALRPLLSKSMRRLGARVLLPHAGPSVAYPALETVDHILDELGTEVAGLKRFGGPYDVSWDLDATRRRYAGGHRP